MGTLTFIDKCYHEKSDFVLYVHLLLAKPVEMEVENCNPSTYKRVCGISKTGQRPVTE